MSIQLRTNFTGNPIKDNRRRNRPRARRSRPQNVVTPQRVKAILFGNSEKKVASTQATGTTISTAGTVINLTNGIVEGDDVGNRSGTKIKVLSQRLRIRFKAITDDQSARFVLFRDLMNVGTTPTVTEVLPTTSYMSHYSDVRTLQQRRFSILVDEVLDCSLSGPTVRTEWFNIGSRGTVYYNGPTAIASANGQGAIFLLVIGSNSTGVFDYDWQVVYNDS